MSKVNGIVFLLPSIPNQSLSYQHDLAIKLEVIKLLPNEPRLYILPLSSYGVPLYEDTVRIYIGSNTLSELDSQQREIFMQDTTLRILCIGNESFHHPGQYYALDSLNPDKLKKYLSYLIESAQEDSPLKPIKKYQVGVLNSIPIDVYLQFAKEVNQEKIRVMSHSTFMASTYLDQPIIVNYLGDFFKYSYDTFDLLVLSEPNSTFKNVRAKSLINIDPEALCPEYLEHVIMTMYKLSTHDQ